MPSITTEDGRRVVYHVDGSGAPVLFLTGVAYDGWFWREQVEALRPHLATVVMEHRGAGKSSRARHPYSTANLAADAAAVVEAVLAEHKETRCHVVGHSLGGFVAQELVLADPGRIDRLVLASTSFGGAHAVPIGAEALEILTNRDGDEETLIRRGVAVATAPTFKENEPERFQAIVAHRMTQPVPADQYQLQVRAGLHHDTADRVKQIAAPTLVLTGSADRVVPPENADLLAEAIPGARLRIVPEAGHIFPLEKPEETNQILLAFLTGSLSEAMLV